MASRTPFSQAVPTLRGCYQLSQPKRQARWANCLAKERPSLLNTERELSAQEFFELFLKERQFRSDFVSRASDVLWKREVFDVDEEKLQQVRRKLAQLQKLRQEGGSGGFLKLRQTKQWGLGVDRAPSNAKEEENDVRTSGYDRRRAGLLEYEALKRELSLLTAVVAAICSIYCGLVISLEASASYGIGSLGSLLYLQLLFRHVDQLSEDDVADVFLRRRQKKIGIRSSDLQDAFEKILFGSGSALSSPRLVVPAALYGLWALAHRLTDLQLEIVPLMFGFFAYKAALLIQAYRDNQNLAMDFSKQSKRPLGS